MPALSDKHIKEKIVSGEIIIEGIKPEDISGASADLTLGSRFRLFKNASVTHIDSANINLDEFTEVIERNPGEPFIIHPGEFILGELKERIKIPNNIIARLDGKSSLGRLGIIVHSTAGNVAPGWDGRLTLEMTNISRMPVALWPGRKVAQIVFIQLTSDAETPYNKKPGSEWNKPLSSKKAI